MSFLVIITSLITFMILVIIIEKMLNQKPKVDMVLVVGTYLK